MKQQEFNFIDKMHLFPHNWVVIDSVIKYPMCNNHANSPSIVCGFAF